MNAGVTAGDAPVSARESRPEYLGAAHEATKPEPDFMPSAASAAPYVLAEDQRHPSQLAYEVAALGDNTTEAAVLALLDEYGPLTHDGLCRVYRASDYRVRSPQRIRSACAALVRLGAVRAAGRGLSDAGNPATCWEVVR